MEVSGLHSVFNRFLRRLMTPFVPVLRRALGVPLVMLEEMPNCPGLFHVYRRLLETGHVRVQGGWLYDGEFYPDYLTVGGNTFAIRHTALQYCHGKGLDIGAAFWPLPGSTPIDTEQGPGLNNRIEDIPPGSQDYVFSSHCLEHIENWKETLDLWISKLKTGGVLFLYLPHQSCKLWHKSNLFMQDIHAWVPTPEVIAEALSKRALEIINRDDGPDNFFSFYVCGRRQF